MSAKELICFPEEDGSLETTANGQPLNSVRSTRLQLRWPTRNESVCHRL